MNTVSIIIPAFNADDTIVECLESLIIQSFQNIEVLVIDDGSTDLTSEKVLQFQQDHQSFNLKLITQGNSGPSSARNFGLRNSTGEYIVFLDADDKLHENYIQRCLNEFINQSHLNLVYSGVKYFDRVSKESLFNSFTINGFLTANVIPVFAMVRRRHLLDICGFDENLKNHEDWELWIRVIKQFGPCVHQIKEPLYYYRKRFKKNSISDLNVAESRIENSFYYIYNKHYEFYVENNLGIYDLLTKSKYENKYRNIWYKQLFYKIKDLFRKGVSDKTPL